MYCYFVFFRRHHHHHHSSSSSSAQNDRNDNKNIGDGRHRNRTSYYTSLGTCCWFCYCYCYWWWWWWLKTRDTTSTDNFIAITFTIIFVTILLESSSLSRSLSSSVAISQSRSSPYLYPPRSSIRLVADYIQSWCWCWCWCWWVSNIHSPTSIHSTTATTTTWRWYYRTISLFNPSSKDEVTIHILMIEKSLSKMMLNDSTVLNTVYSGTML